ncbi:MAG: hypothetical protein H6842_00315 [Rhodospirillaceae bacterium]|nr:hypothetical protein [Rhodospirillaceae bacterium]
MLWKPHEPAEDVIRRISQMRRLIQRLSLVIGLATAVAVPAGTFAAGFFALAHDLQFKAQLNAERLARHAHVQGPTWSYAVEHLEHVISLSFEADMQVRQRIWDARGRLVLDSGGDLAAPLVWRANGVVLRGESVGRIAVGASLLPLLVNTGVAAFVGLLLGAAAWLAMHVLAGRSLKVSLAHLRDAHEDVRRHAAETANAYDELQRQYRIVEETTEQLMRARDDALAADRSKSAFLATMSHELRTPLNAIIGFSDMINSEVFGRVENDQYRTYIQDIHESGLHLLAIINDVLDLSKIEAGRLVLHVKPVDLSVLIDECDRLMGARVASAGIDLIAGAAAGALPIIRADPVKLKQIILNLLSNAVKFTPEGGSVTIAAAKVNDLQVTISVTDTGIGMTEEEVAIALQPFHQVDNELSRRYEGTGLGLPLARALAEEHGGRLSITSAPGQGTAVTVTLPVYGPPAYRDFPLDELSAPKPPVPQAVAGGDARSAVAAPKAVNA